MTNQDLYNLHSALTVVGNLNGAKDPDFNNSKFAYAVSKNKTFIENECKSIDAANKQSEKMVGFQKEEIDLRKKHAKKDKNKNPMIKIIGNIQQYDIENMELFDKDFDVLKKKHKEAIDEQEKKNKKFQDFLKEENKCISFHKIKREDCPPEMNGNQMQAISAIIEDF